MLASTASTPAQGGAIIRFSGTKEAKNEAEVSYIVFASRRHREEKRRKERRRGEDLFSADDERRSFSLSGRMITESIEENHYRMHGWEKGAAGVIIKFP